GETAIMAPYHPQGEEETGNPSFPPRLFPNRKEFTMSDSQAKRTMPRMLISLLITLAIGAVWFYISLPAINLHNTSFYSFVFILLLVCILVSIIVLGMDTGRQEIHLRDYLSF